MFMRWRNKLADDFASACKAVRCPCCSSLKAVRNLPGKATASQAALSWGLKYKPPGRGARTLLACGGSVTPRLAQPARTTQHTKETPTRNHDPAKTMTNLSMSMPDNVSCICFRFCVNFQFIYFGMISMRQRRHLLQFLALSALPAAWAQTPSAFPSKPLRIVVPFGAGGVADLTARAVAQKLSENLGQPVVIDNRPGAGGIVAAELVAKAEPDGHTLFLMSNGTAVSAGLFKRLPFNPRTDFAPISLLGLFDIALAVPESSPHKTLADLVSFGRANPGQLNIGTINIGSTQHLAGELFRSQANLIAQIIPYNGTPAVINALRGGQVDVVVEILGPLKPQISAKAVRLLGVMGATRPKDQPQVPVVRELPGLSSFNVSSWNALAAPGKTPKAVVDRLSAEVAKVLAEPEMVKRLAGFNVQAQSSTPEQLALLLDSEIKRWSEVIQKAGIAQG
jgi:tripartite-type tricarboxylate transporter receptor subunit TctC